MNSLYIWGNAPVLTVEQAAFLSVGVEPFDNEEKPNNVKAMLNLLANAINTKGLDAEISCKADVVGWNRKDDNNEEYFYNQHPEHKYGVDIRFYKKPDWKLTTVKTVDLKVWLSSINVKYPPFFSETTSASDCLSKDHPRYSAKLAAAVKVWLAMEDGNLLKGKATKAALTTWLETNYQELGLVYDGNINKTGIEECTKVANWSDKGGATKTPSR